MRLTRSTLTELDRAAAEMKLSRAEVVRRAVRDYRSKQAIGPKK